jgi:hypothetical protein
MNSPSELQKDDRLHIDLNSETDQKHTGNDPNLELFDTINSQIKEDFKYMMIVLFPFLLIKIFVLQLANCVDTLLGLR